MTAATRSTKVLIPFNTGGFLYGLERAVIELFDSLRPGITPHFRDRCGSNAAARFQTVYSPQRVVDGWERLLEEH